MSKIDELVERLKQDTQEAQIKFLFALRARGEKILPGFSKSERRQVRKQLARVLQLQYRTPGTTSRNVSSRQRKLKDNEGKRIMSLLPSGRRGKL